MRSCLFTASILCAAAGAQAPTNLFEIYSGCTNFTSRGNVQTNAGEYLQEIRSSHFVGVGHDSSGFGTRLNGFQYVTQDQSGVTQETYHLVVRADATGGPDCSAAGLLLRAGPLQTPATTVPSPVAWLITATLATPSTALPICPTYYIGAEFPAAPLWPNDGQSLHIVDFPTGDNPASGAPTLTWNCVGGVVSQPSFFESIRIGMLVEAAVLNMGNVDPTVTIACLQALGNRSFGVGGMFPACNGAAGPRNDGLDCRVRDRANAGGVFALFVGAGGSCPGLPLGGLANGALYLPLTLFVQVASGTLDAAGLGVSTVLPPNSPACSAVANRFIDFQAFTVPPTFTLPGNLSNRASVNYRR